MHLRARGLIFVFSFCLCVAGYAAQQEEEINFQLVRSNPLLRQVLSANSPYAETGDSGSLQNKFREHWVDSQVEHFLKETHRKLSELKASVQRASSASSELAADDSGKRALALTSLRQSLVKAEDQSKNLRTSLSIVLQELATADKFNVKVSREAKADGFKKEIESLSEQTANAERSIRDYFFKPTHVTSVADLKTANMLDYLKRIERISRAIREKLH